LIVVETTSTVLVSPVMVAASAVPPMVRDLPVSRVAAVPAAATAAVSGSTVVGMTWYLSTAVSRGVLDTSWGRVVPSALSSWVKAASVGTRMVPAAAKSGCGVGVGALRTRGSHLGRDWGGVG
jgi:hypothetical protein